MFICFPSETNWCSPDPLSAWASQFLLSWIWHHQLSQSGWSGINFCDFSASFFTQLQVLGVIGWLPSGLLCLSAFACFLHFCFSSFNLSLCSVSLSPRVCLSLSVFCLSIGSFAHPKVIWPPPASSLDTWLTHLFAKTQERSLTHCLAAFPVPLLLCACKWC